ncbi:hypothetical protein [Pseudosulfitobacter koreensis]|uniref:Uncharacterized protein n=1 Tax=Pseudosulfitobacter koreensis TaxID=2968472 RepID=A0ABT1Z2K2_9RHOB|nr:hypothetical protein [Pseudosulfitobacter koreense]MCR8827360.1 hypothetical protein [Pseudosulfitobacter koreense]
MNALTGKPEPEPEEPPIIIMGIARKSYYLLKGDAHLDQILLADGTYPTPILCVYFEDIFDTKRVLGDQFNLGALWGIHPDIIHRLRETQSLIETEA